MSLLYVIYGPFLRVLYSPTAPSSRPSASATCIARSRCNSPSAPARWSESGRMADSAANTGYEPKFANFFSYMEPDHTPINIPDSHHNFLCPDEATMIPTSPEGLPNSEASSSSKQAASRVSSLCGTSSIWTQCACHVSGRLGLQELGQSLTDNLLRQRFFVHSREGKDIETRTFVHSLRDSYKSPKRSLNGKLIWPSEE